MSYATTSDLAAYLNVEISSLPADAQRLLDRAGELIDYVTLGRVDASSPNDLAAARDAACAQAEYWIANGETDLSPSLSSKSVGRVSMTYAETSRGSAGYEDLSPRARRFLLRVGLLRRKVELR